MSDAATGAVVTGFGAVTPLGVGADTLHERAVAGESALHGGRGHCRGFRAADHLPRHLVRRTDRFTQFALVAADEAVARAGWTPGALPYDAARVACVIGCGLGGTASFEAQGPVLAEQGAEYVSALMVPQMMANAAASHLSMRYGFRGESLCVASACSSGAQAIGAGLRLLAAGAADAVVVGGAEASTSELVSAAFRNAGALSPTGRCLPFDTDRDGFVIGEGAGVLVLETARGATRRGAGVLGAVRGYGATSDAHHLTAPDPGGGPAAEAVVRALRQAGTDPGELDYVNAHGTGTPLNDRSECDALRLALGGDVLARVPMSSSKGGLGHLFGAAGAVEAVATLQALRRGVAPPTAGLRRPDERLGRLDLIRTARELPGGRARVGLSTSFGFGGHNAALVLSASSTDERP
ncbi:beta-ketoacyl-[acyl-carrier-protein] synthase family protein [Streptomyces sudanensis]|uniref:beta-ketoacyl-[acyl-carrier-protein] synthase family protein n=1 Tax=Streptomyces sudanensis TaxID=436397 RepID=UPI0020CD2A34|nr:beta-ketoacyl-[acyl-carrier-protein] synthase family protein [Streptomyces sudanensis]MCP9956115.1 beta-ketoacyl-[acyl-carrier-protein] synthase family protein [Streptomyces sudanensis]MCP9985342.1 beta-ketoacyl-[acyl-carrier-protein] synthase family protein [Streptomyces sudanensis]MCQ0003246.1 beta-ketoacyl-[acyl-carrier-protein] synthase family protein [Streptomyces sudanensis]